MEVRGSDLSGSAMTSHQVHAFLERKWRAPFCPGQDSSWKGVGVGGDSIVYGPEQECLSHETGP